MSVLQLVKPGAVPGKILLSVDLTEAGDSEVVLKLLNELGYSPTIRHVSYKQGVHVHALLKEEGASGDDAQMVDEWMSLINVLSQDSVHLWRGGE